MAVPTHTDIQFKIRIPAALKIRIDAAAHKNSRSTTAEIVAALEEKYPEPVAPGNDIERLRMLTYLIDAALSDDGSSVETKALHLRAAKKVMRQLVDRMSAEDVDKALCGWIMPPSFDLFD